MDVIRLKTLIGERALFKCNDTQIIDCIFKDGESPLKEGRNLQVNNCSFYYKYPLWYGDNHIVKDSTFYEMSRSGIWYTSNSKFSSCKIIAPKLFRRCSNIILEDITFDNALETLWTCNKVTLNNVKADNGDYFGKDSKDIKIENLKLNGNYCFDGGEDIYVNNSILNSKDAFWNCKNVTIENSTIIGEYFGWNSENITLKNCKISSHQGFCYMKNIKLDDCSIYDSDLIFEYCQDIDATIVSTLDSVKNPISGIIRSKGIKELILDDNSIDFNKVKFEDR